MPLAEKPTVQRGTLVTDGANPFSITFQFNPAEINDTRSVTYGQHAVPGASHPVYQFGAGGERLLSFTLYLDADLGARATRWNSNLFFDANNSNLLSLSEVLDDLRSLTYPVERISPAGIKIITVPTVYFSMGTLLESDTIECIVKRADPQITFYSPDLRPLKAKVELELAQVARKRVLASTVRFSG